MTEHWLCDSNKDVYQLNSFVIANLFCRKTFKHGGVAIYVKKNINFKPINNFLDVCIEKDFEITSIDLPDLNTLVLNIYRSPVGDLNTFFNHLSLTLNRCLNFKNRKLVIGGDFNIDTSNPNNATTLLKDLLKTFNLNISNNVPTHINKNSATVIDNIFSDIDKQDYNICVFDPVISDHKGILFTFKHKNNTRKHEIKMCRPITQNNIIRFTEILHNASWDTVYRSTNAVDCYKQFHNIFFSAFNLCFPIKYKQPNKMINTWFNRDLKSMRNTLQALNTVHETTRTEDSKNALLKFRKKYKLALTEAKKKSNALYIETASNKCKATWDLIKGESNNRNIINIEANNFNKFFTQVGHKTVNNISSAYTHSDFLAKSDKSPAKTIFFSEVTEDEIHRHILNLKNSNCKDIYGLNAKILKSTFHTIKSPLLFVINKCIQANIFPDELKYAKVSPLYKKGDKDDVSNYRPISILPTISKVFEKIIHERIVNFLEKNNIYYNLQFGFRQQKSTTHAAIEIINEIVNCFNAKENISATLLDLTKAFDCVNHNNLLDKIYYYGIRGPTHSLICNYLKNRKQVVCCEGSISTAEDITIGVPQGSILGPLLFLLYINDLPWTCTPNKLVLFADDTTLINIATNPSELKYQQQNNLNEAEKWFEANKLKINMEKTQHIIFSTQNNQQAPSTAKCLGFFLDSGLLWHPHVDYVASKLAKCTFQIRKLMELTSPDIAKTFYFSNFHSILTYGVVLWGGCASAERVFVIQKHAVRLLSGSKSREHCHSAFVKQKILTFPSLFIFECLLYVKLNINIMPVLEHKYETRNINQIVIPYHRIDRTQRQPLSYTAIKLYNKLSITTKNLNFKQYKQKIKQYLLRKGFYSINEFIKNCDI